MQERIGLLHATLSVHRVAVLVGVNFRFVRSVFTHNQWLSHRNVQAGSAEFERRYPRLVDELKVGVSVASIRYIDTFWVVSLRLR